MTDSAATIAPASRVRLHYRLASGDGVEVDSSFDDEPLDLTVGDGSLHPNLERLLIGLASGEHVQWVLGAEEAFGMRDEARVQRLLRGDFHESIELVAGHVVGFATPSGVELPGRIEAFEGDEVVIDFNHPLAGVPVLFEVEILAVEPGHD